MRHGTGQTTSDPIDIATGSFVHQHPDLPSLGGLGLPLSFERFYASSRSSLTSTLGFGWNHTYLDFVHFSEEMMR
jgi:hypothetical protein